MNLDVPLRLADCAYLVFRKHTGNEMLVHQFRALYSSLFNEKDAPSRAKILKLPMIKSQFSDKYQKPALKLIIEKEDICSCDRKSCQKIHTIKKSDICASFSQHESCNVINCDKLHIPKLSLQERVLEIFKKSGRTRMPFTKFINYHRELFPSIRDHIPTGESLLRVSQVVAIDVSQNKKEIRLLRSQSQNQRNTRVPTLSENIDAPHPALKVSNLDPKWCDSAALIEDLARLFPRFGIKDVFIPGHKRLARVTLDSKLHAYEARKKLNNSWCFGRKVSVSIDENNDQMDAKNGKKDGNESKKECCSVIVGIINNIVTEHQITQWMKRIGKIVKVELYFLNCNKSSEFAFVHLKSMQMINDHIAKLKNVRFRDAKKKLVVTPPNPDYTDPSSYYANNAKSPSSSGSGSDAAHSSNSSNASSSNAHNRRLAFDDSDAKEPSHPPSGRSRARSSNSMLSPHGTHAMHSVHSLHSLHSKPKSKLMRSVSDQTSSAHDEPDDKKTSSNNNANNSNHSQNSNNPNNSSNPNNSNSAQNSPQDASNAHLDLMINVPAPLASGRSAQASQKSLQRGPARRSKSQTNLLAAQLSNGHSNNSTQSTHSPNTSNSSNSSNSFKSSKSSNSKHNNKKSQRSGHGSVSPASPNNILNNNSVHSSHSSHSSNNNHYNGNFNSSQGVSWVQGAHGKEPVPPPSRAEVDKKSMQLLVQRLESLIDTVHMNEYNIKRKLKILSLLGTGMNYDASFDTEYQASLKKMNQRRKKSLAFDRNASNSMNSVNSNNNRMKRRERRNRKGRRDVSKDDDAGASGADASGAAGAAGAAGDAANGAGGDEMEWNEEKVVEQKDLEDVSTESSADAEEVKQQQQKQGNESNDSLSEENDEMGAKTGAEAKDDKDGRKRKKQKQKQQNLQDERDIFETLKVEKGDLSIDFMKTSLATLKSDVKQVQVYKKALVVFNQSLTRGMSKAKVELQPLADKESKVAVELERVNGEINRLEKQLSILRGEQHMLQKQASTMKSQGKHLRQLIGDLATQLAPIDACLAAFDRNSQAKFHVPSLDMVSNLDEEIVECEKVLQHWLNYQDWTLQDFEKWVCDIENARFLKYKETFRQLNKINQGSILNAMTDGILQLIGIDDQQDREALMQHIEKLKKRCEIVRKSVIAGKEKFGERSSGKERRGMNAILGNVNNKEESNLCVICWDRERGPYACVPCGHQCLCEQCKDLIVPHKSRCPYCNVPLQMIMKLFKPA